MDIAPTCDRKGQPAKVIDESGDEPLTRIIQRARCAEAPQVFAKSANG